MNETLTLTGAWLAGVALGSIFFGSLWWTVRRGVLSRYPALWFLGSFLLRMGIALPGFYFVSGGDWRRLLLCLVGFVTARLALTRLAKAPTETRKRPATEAHHAP
jgi:F1F0 ATPase subunit 2